jgi:Cu-Zn family superoxide dismutase
MGKSCIFRCGVLITAMFTGGCGVSEGIDDTAETEQAVMGGSVSTVLMNAAGAAVGMVTFKDKGGSTMVSTTLSFPGVAADFHGFHVHANDDPANGTGCVPPTFVSADGHYNPTSQTHGDHAGDMPVLLVMGNGEASLSFLTDGFTVSDIVGRAVIVHAGRNNYGNIPVGLNPDQYTANSPAATALTEATGNAGARIACGVIQ